MLPGTKPCINNVRPYFSSQPNLELAVNLFPLVSGSCQIVFWPRDSTQRSLKSQKLRHALEPEHIFASSARILMPGRTNFMLNSTSVIVGVNYFEEEETYTAWYNEIKSLGTTTDGFKPRPAVVCTKNDGLEEIEVPSLGNSRSLNAFEPRYSCESSFCLQQFTVHIRLIKDRVNRAMKRKAKINHSSHNVSCQKAGVNGSPIVMRRAF